MTSQLSPASSVTSRNYSKYKVDDVSGARGGYCANISCFTMTNHKIQVRNRYLRVSKYTSCDVWKICVHTSHNCGEKSKKVVLGLSGDNAEQVSVCLARVSEPRISDQDNCRTYPSSLSLSFSLWGRPVAIMAITRSTKRSNTTYMETRKFCLWVNFSSSRFGKKRTSFL